MSWTFKLSLISGFKTEQQGYRPCRLFWVAVKELKLSYCIGETLLFTMYTDYGNLISSSLTATQSLKENCCQLMLGRGKRSL